MSVTIWPEEYERKDHINREERILLRTALKYMKAGDFVTGIDPVGLANEKVHMGMMIVPNSGLVTFSILDGQIDVNAADQYINFVNMIEGKIYERLIGAKALISRDGQNKALKFPYKHFMLFVNEKSERVKCSEELKKRIGSYVALQFLIPLFIDKNTSRKDYKYLFEKTRMPYAEGDVNIGETERKAIFERLAPEYTIVLPEKVPVTIPKAAKVVNETDLHITGNEVEYKTFFLDKYQVAQVNDIGKGHRVILANPGAGKSVILLAKAFKYASLFKDSKILLTCYNSNLADAYVFKKNCANFGDNNNLYIMTLHKLVKKLYQECLGKNVSGEFASDEEIRFCIDKVKSGEIKVRFKAIFIDEVQIFDPLYLELCYYLLEPEDNTFLMAGDLNQTVRSQSRRGDAPWKRIEGVSLDFTGRVKYIEKNYRNSKEIGEYLNHMLCYMNKKMEELQLGILPEYNYDLFELTDKKSLALKIKTGVSRMAMQKEVVSAVKEIVEKYDTGYSEIGILFPYKDHKSLNYHFLYWLTKGLDKEGIPYSLITPAEGIQRTRYSQTSGVVISTIDSSLGLDFKAVIFAGLYPFNYVFSDNGYKHQLSTWQDIKKLKPEDQEKAQIQIRKLYTACSRAREILYVISDIDRNTPLDDVLTK